MSGLFLTTMSGLPADATNQPPVVPTTANPDLTKACGVDFALILDRSGSIKNAGAEDLVRNAARAFLGGLENTGSTASLVSFAGTASADVAPTLLDTASMPTFENAITALTFTGATNWEDALVKAQAQFPAFPNNAPERPDLVVMITDGNPTTYSGDSSNSGADTGALDINKAVLEADKIKLLGAHMFAVGVGEKPALDEENLQAISGTDEFPASGIRTADWTKVSTFGELQSRVKAVGDALCSIDIVKSAPAQAHEGDTVTYSFKVTNTGDSVLTDIAVTDDILGTIGTVDTLDPGASVMLQKDYVVPAGQAADVVNQGKACAAELCAVDEHVLDVLHPAITIDKTAAPLAVRVGDSVTFTYVVKNTGDTPLSSLVVTDDKLGLIQTGAIGVGESQSFTKTIVVSADTPLRNVGTATAADPLGRSVTDDDDANIDVTAVLGVQLTNPAPLTPTAVSPIAVLPVTGAGSRAPLAGLAALLMGAVLLGVSRRKRTA